MRGIPAWTLIVAIIVVGSHPLAGQARPRTGPVIMDFGPVYDVTRVDFATPVDRAYRVIFDVAPAPADSTVRNDRLDAVARFLNLQARAGVPRDSLQAVLILHGPASRATLRNEHYRARFGVDNPDLPLLEALRGAGVRVLLCGQSAMSRGLDPDLLSPYVEVALSATTALIVLQQDGYVLIP
jgi:intracellular sulfur oxidation DsrE/DsrF family protein